jgi:2-aminoadipate transaminase
VLESAFPKSIRYTRPDGGLFTWLSFPDGFDTTKFMIEHALPQAKVVYVPGAPFYALLPETNHARFNFSALPEEQLIAGMERLGKLLTQAIG